jgi:hypothetical protein
VVVIDINVPLGSSVITGSGEVVLDLFHRPHVSIFWVQVDRAQGTSLTEQVPALVQLLLEQAQGRAVGDSALVLGVAELLAQRVLTVDESSHLPEQKPLRVI